MRVIAAAALVASAMAAPPTAVSNPRLKAAWRGHWRGLGRRRAAFPEAPRGSIPALRPVDSTSTDGYVLSVVDFGADPTGVNDSTKAISSAIDMAWQIGRQNGYNFSWGPDIGGVVIDLVGGQYLLESPVVWPAEAGGNVVVQHGSLHAGESFPPGRYLFELDMVPPPPPGSSGAAARPCDAAGDPLAPCLSEPRLRGTATGYDDITFRSVLFDAAMRGGGGVKLVNALRVVFDGCYFLGYAAGAAGLWTSEAGGAVYVAQSWFSGFDWPSDKCADGLNLTGTAMLIEFPDSMADDVIVACSAAGMVVHSGAFIAQSVHVFGVLNEPGKGYMTLAKPAGGARLVAPYVDFSRVFVDPGLPLSIDQGFFLGCPGLKGGNSTPAFVDVDASAVGGDVVTVVGLSVRNSQFRGHGCDGGAQPLAINTVGLAGRPMALVDTVVEGNVFQGVVPATTRPRGAVFGSNTSSFALNLTRSIAFPRVRGLGSSAFESVLYSVKTYAGEPFVASQIDGSSSEGDVVVITSQAVSGSVSVLADQSRYSV